ncbi:hypothetical protein [Sediminibacterium soli]|uniref:hypothetical protein n=1 Tax=Sediminibacterium soli TaxID=2698829 RepID=UPI00137A3144|nr:hypothetical protein [Sediminibacterium soli]NCI48238.1 hypothetical protein [Sediminibacterium soli]
MKRVLIMALLLVAAISVSLTRGLPKEKEILLPHASASSEALSGNERVIALDSNMAINQDKDIRIVQKGKGYVLQIKHANLPMEEYAVKPEKKQDNGNGM